MAAICLLNYTSRDFRQLGDSRGENSALDRHRIKNVVNQFIWPSRVSSILNPSGPMRGTIP
jgi:hypothetical protein